MKLFRPQQQDADNLALARELSKQGVLLELYSIFDKLAQSYAPPFVAQNDGTAARMLLASAQQQNSLLAAHPADFDLYSVGAINQSTGIISQDEVRYVGSFAAILEVAMRANPSSGAVKA